MGERNSNFPHRYGKISKVTSELYGRGERT